MGMVCSLILSQIFFSFQSKGLECYSLDYLYAFYVFFIVKNIFKMPATAEI